MHSTLELSEVDGWIGRLFMAGMPGPEMDRETETLIRDHCLGGIILFSRNIQDPIQLASLCSRLQETAMESQGIPLFLAVDQEGGRVARLQEPFTAFPGNGRIGNDPHAGEKALAFGEITAREMRLVGLNMDMAPVVDVLTGPADQHLAGRMFGSDPARVGMLGQCVIKGLQENGVMAVAKHFPGLGRATRDPHHNLPIIEADMHEMEETHLPPFKAAMDQNVSAVMTSHALYPVLDPEWPATLSRRIVTGVMRERLGFDGLVITDDLEMGAVRKRWGVARAAVAGFHAGCDILLICSDQGTVLEGMTLLRKTLLRGEMPLQRLRESVQRVMRAKERFLGRGTDISLDEIREYFKTRVSIG